MVRAFEWADGKLRLLDQRLLPTQEVWVDCLTFEDVVARITDMTVRGAPAIGVTAAYGMAMAAFAGADRSVADHAFRTSRPTAVNLFWALDRLAKVPEWTGNAILAEARLIDQEDLEMNHKIGELGATLVPQNAHILTICNTGALATSGHGTALGIIRTAHAQGKNIFVNSCETRPRMQGLRLTAWELTQDQIPFQSIADSCAASLMAAGKIDLVVAGADRIAANGDTANKIGTMMLAVLAKHFGIPFYIAAPSSTLDPSLPSGDQIPIEERSSEELTRVDGVQVAPEGCPVFNPAFDVTPGELIAAIITEQGIFRQPYQF